MPGEEYIIPLGIDLSGVVNRIQPVTNSLNEVNRAAQTAGTGTRAAFNATAQAADAASRSITGATSQLNIQGRASESLRVEMQRLQAQQSLTFDPARIVAYNKRIEQLQDQITRLNNAGRRGFDDLGNAIQSNTNTMGGFVSSLKSAAGALGLVFGIQQLVAWGKELFNIANEASGVERAFARLGRPDLLPALREQTRGFISDLDLERLTVRANNFKIPVDQLGVLLAFAAERAKDTGENVDKLTEDIISGLGRKSTRIIDNLGISAIEVQNEFKKTGDFTQAVSNIIQREMGLAGVAVDTLADKTNRAGTFFSNLWKNIATGLSTAIQDGGLADNNIIENLTSTGLKAQKDFNSKSAAERQKAIQDQLTQISSLSAAYTKFAKEQSAGFTNLSSTLGGTARNQNQIDQDKKDTGERLVAAQNILKYLKQQNDELNKTKRFSQDIVSLDEKRLQVADLTSRANGIIVAPGDTTSADAIKRKQLLQDAKDIQQEIDDIVGVSNKKNDQLAESALKKQQARDIKLVSERKSLNDQLTKLQNDYYSSQIAAIEDDTTRNVAKETVDSQNRVRSLENQKASLQERVKQFPELQKQYATVLSQIDDDIAQETTQSTARVNLIIKKGEEANLKLRQDSIKDIAGVLKEETDVQELAINERYDKIRADAKKAGTLTTTLEKQLSVQQAKDVQAATIKIQDSNLKKQEDVALSAIYARKKKEGDSQEKYERDNQIAILQIEIQFAQARLALIANDPSKVKEVNDLTAAIYKAQNALKGLKEAGTGDLFDALGINGDTFQKYGKAISTVGQQFSDLFAGLVDGAQARIDQIDKQMQAVDDMISKDEEAVDKEQDLADAGRANNLTTAQKKLADDKKQKAELQKQEDDAQKKKQALQQAQLVADSIAQVSNLITASSEIFKSLASIPFVGVPLAIALIGTMFGAFAVAKVNAFNATKQTAAEGGTAGGNLHSEGGNKYVSSDGNDQHILEIERGEEIIKRTSSAKHRKLLKAINKDDFSNIDINDISIREILEGTGVSSHIEVARKAGEHNKLLQERSQVIVINSGSSTERTEQLLSSINKNLMKMGTGKKEVYDMGDYYWIIEGNNKTKVYKD